MQLDDWVLCKLYKKTKKNSLTNEKSKVEDVHDSAKKTGIVEEDDRETVKMSGTDQTSNSIINDSTNQNHNVNYNNHTNAYLHNYTSVYDPHHFMNDDDAAYDLSYFLY